MLRRKHSGIEQGYEVLNTVMLLNEECICITSQLLVIIKSLFGKPDLLEIELIEIDLFQLMYFTIAW